MSDFRPYHVMYRDKIGRGKWRVWCELSSSRMRLRAMHRLSFIWKKQYIFGTQDHGHEAVTRYRLNCELEESAAARSRSTLAPMPPAEDPESR
jgi:hypothetical protein